MPSHQPQCHRPCTCTLAPAVMSELRVEYRDIIFSPGRRLRVSIGTHMGLWIIWGWRAQYQMSFGSHGIQLHFNDWYWHS